MPYLLDRVRAIVQTQYQANADAARTGAVEDWPAYRHITGWLAGADYILQAVEEAERERGL